MMTPNHKIIFVAFTNMMQVGALVGDLKCGVAIKGMGEEQENRRETERKEKRKKTEKD